MTSTLNLTELKAGYKESPQSFEERGIRGAIESGHQELMGKALSKDADQI